MKKEIRIIWDYQYTKGHIETSRCSLSDIWTTARGNASNNNFRVYGKNGGIILALEKIEDTVGTRKATITVRSETNPFTFNISDVNSAYPIHIDEYKVIVTEGSDTRTFREIEKSIEAKRMLTAIQKIDKEPEENYEKALDGAMNYPSPTWLGISRDVHNFEIGYVGMPTYDNLFVEGSDYIKPRLGGWPLRLYKDLPIDYRFRYMIGRGVSCAKDLKRSLEDGFMPILNSSFEDGGIEYKSQMFATLEKSKLVKENVKGTHYLVSDANFSGFMHTPEQQKSKEDLWDSEMNRDEEVVLYFRTIAENNNDVPVYAFMTMPSPIGPSVIKYDKATGIGTVENEMAYIIATVNGNPVAQTETAILVPPGEKLEYLFIIPHSPIPMDRAVALKEIAYSDRLAECKDYWNEKAGLAMKVSLPEKRIENMMKAGFCHLDLISTGNEPDGPLAPNIGFYCPIGSESSPIIQYYDSIGRTDLASRALDYFFAKQHDDGFMQNFGGYMLETGAVLWTTYLHYLYTDDVKWLAGKEEKIVKSADYLLDWGKRNLRKDLIGRGYGMLDGKVADPEDPYHSYMLNAYAYAGLLGSAKILQKIGSDHYERINAGTEDLRNHILTALNSSIADSPVIPLGNGKWCPSVAPWPEYRGPLCLTVDGGNFSTHGSVTARDSLLGATYLLYLNVIDINDVFADFIVNSFSEILYQRHTAFSQPFYSPHTFVNLKRGERKAFIKEFYNCFAGISDKETYTFWEHYQLVSIHKTHEEAGFLMRCRNMLYTELTGTETENTLVLMPGVPSAWFLSNEDIALKGANCYFGELSYEMSHAGCYENVKLHVKLDSRTGTSPNLI
ncbi:MAG: hypothetical protein ACYCYI_08655, partial [Saccharofermentanales bacterium]